MKSYPVFIFCSCAQETIDETLDFNSFEQSSEWAVASNPSPDSKLVLTPLNIDVAAEELSLDWEFSGDVCKKILYYYMYASHCCDKKYDMIS